MMQDLSVLSFDLSMSNEKGVDVLSMTLCKMWSKIHLDNGSRLGACTGKILCNFRVWKHYLKELGDWWRDHSTEKRGYV